MTILKTAILNTGLWVDMLFYDLTIESYTGWVGKEFIDLIRYPNFFHHFCFNLRRFLRQVTPVGYVS